MTSDHLPRGRRGVKRMSQLSASYLSLCPSIQPWHSAASTASALETVATPESFLNSRSHSPARVRGALASHASNAAALANASTGKPALISSLITPA